MTANLQTERLGQRLQGEICERLDPSNLGSRLRCTGSTARVCTLLSCQQLLSGNAYSYGKCRKAAGVSLDG